MDNSWRFGSIQPPLSAYPYPPLPPHQNPIYNPVRDPNPLSNQYQLRQQTSFSESDGSRKRMRVEDPRQLAPPSRITHDDQWRLNMIRDYGRHDASFDEKKGFENAGNSVFNPQIGGFSSYNNNNHYDSFRPPLENKTNPYDQQYGNSNPYNDYRQSYSYFPRPSENQLKTFDGTKEVIISAYNINGAINNGGNGYNEYSQTYCPPLPPNPPPPEPSPPPYYYERPSMPNPLPNTSANLFPITPQKTQSSYYHKSTPLPIVNSQSMVHSVYYGDVAGRASTGIATETSPFLNHHTPSNVYSEGRAQALPSRSVIKDKPILVDACQLFKHPHRTSRPDHFVIILRGLPGSGKSYMAKALRDLEVESGGNAPRIHSMDDYFMIEVEKKVEENEGSKATTSSRGKKQITKKVIEYCFEPEMEEAYRSSMLKAFKKTLDEGNYRVIIVDDRNLRVADFAQFWAIAKRSGYEVYLLEAAYKDPTGCAARNVHGFTEESIQNMAEQWEEAPSLYLQLDISSLFREDNLCSQSIREVDMDTDDVGCEEEQYKLLHQSEGTKNTESEPLNHTPDGSVKFGERWDDEEEFKGNDLSSSKWSKDEDEEEDNLNILGSKPSALTGLIQAYAKKEKSVHWGDQVKKSGFSIGAVEKQNNSSLVIGPGSGYNLSTNPLPENKYTSQQNGSVKESKRRFTDQLQAERESFKAVFDQRRRHHIGGFLDIEDE